MTGDDERYERVQHQMLFLFDQGLVSREMSDCNRQLRLLEGLVGKDSGKLDPHLRERLYDELESATSKQLRETGLFQEWRESWNARESAQQNSSRKPVTAIRPLPIRS